MSRMFNCRMYLRRLLFLLAHATLMHMTHEGLSWSLRPHCICEPSTANSHSSICEMSSTEKLQPTSTGQSNGRSYYMLRPPPACVSATYASLGIC
eukprot:scaffold401340_cov24-Prasinocladus_malaysianus.AAC.1